MENEKYKILVIDDELTILELIKDILIDLGYLITTASGGAEALNILKTSNFDLILCDITMPGQSGFDVLQEVQRMNTGIKFIFISAFDNQENIKKGTSMGAKAFLGKPFNNEELIDVVERTLKN